MTTIDPRRARSAPKYGALLLALAGCASAAVEPARPTLEIPTVAQAPAPAPVLSVEPSPLPAGAADPSLGNADALVTLVIFGDLEDPFYRRAIDEVRAHERRFGPEKLRVVYKHLPALWHKHARDAEIAAEAVFRAGGSAAFWSFHDAALAGPELRADRYEGWALDAGVTAAAYRHALGEAASARKIDDDASLAEAQHVVAAPWIFVNGAECSTRTHCTFLTGGEKSRLALLIEAELEQAVAALASGVPRQKLYAERTTENLANPPRFPEPAPKAPAVEQAESQPKLGARHLMIMYQGSRRASVTITRTKDEARARATEAMRKARKKGQSFADVATEYSDEPGAADRGGDLGKFPRGAMVPEFENALLKLKVGEISDVVETVFGFHVIQRTQ